MIATSTTLTAGFLTRKPIAVLSGQRHTSCAPVANRMAQDVTQDPLQVLSNSKKTIWLTARYFVDLFITIKNTQNEVDLTCNLAVAYIRWNIKKLDLNKDAFLQRCAKRNKGKRDRCKVRSSNSGVIEHFSPQNLINWPIRTQVFLPNSIWQA